MSILKKRIDFRNSDEGVRVELALRMMEDDVAYNTEASYSANTETYPNNLMPFVDKHMKYLSEHQSINTYEYLSNLRLMTRRK